ncbi:nucleotidyltransferase domain-containing protein [Nocardioides speluncae]|uniref:nucleotidyltransferase domain-containing protein n=1 Tax=Nocardioides speluncae TaxID=2670337 RepID=UPI000D694106|nr:nucleotidyltransferase domain-containing protein [Nocardioides speluncae]
MLLERPFLVVTPTVDGDILLALASAEAEFTPGEVHRLIGEHSLSGVRKALARLTDQGIVAATRRGNAFTYQLSRKHLAAPAIVELAGLRQRFVEKLRLGLAEFTHQPAYGALFGSAARGDMRVDSDVDLFLIPPDRLDELERQKWEVDVAALSEAATAWVGNDLRVLEMSGTEARQGLAEREPVLVAVRAEGIPLAGSDRVWRADA